MKIFTLYFPMSPEILICEVLHWFKWQNVLSSIEIGLAKRGQDTSIRLKKANVRKQQLYLPGWLSVSKRKVSKVPDAQSTSPDANLTFLTRNTPWKWPSLLPGNPWTSQVSSSLYFLNKLLVPSLLFKPPTISSKQVSHCLHPGQMAGEEDSFRDMRCGFEGPVAGERERSQKMKKPVWLRPETVGEEAGEAGRQAGPRWALKATARILVSIPQ